MMIALGRILNRVVRRIPIIWDVYKWLVGSR